MYLSMRQAKSPDEEPISVRGSPVGKTPSRKSALSKNLSWRYQTKTELAWMLSLQHCPKTNPYRRQRKRKSRKNTGRRVITLRQGSGRSPLNVANINIVSYTE